jgi:hypothetical protein
MGANLLQCDTAGQATPIAQTCSSAARCHAAGMTGVCYLCDPGEYNCAGSVLQECAPDRLSFVDGPDCGSASLCDDTGGQCLPDGSAGAPG